MKKKTYIVSTYDNYEWITTKNTYFLWLLKLEYMKKGYNTWNYPMWFIMLVFKYTGKSIFRDVNVRFEKYIPGSDQITYWTPWMNFN